MWLFPHSCVMWLCSLLVISVITHMSLVIVASVLRFNDIFTLMQGPLVYGDLIFILVTDIRMETKFIMSDSVVINMVVRCFDG
jgi:hypothetical protein